MSLCLFLRLKHFELVLQFIQLGDHLVFLSVELLLGLAIVELGVLSSFSVFAETVDLQFGFV